MSGRAIASALLVIGCAAGLFMAHRRGMFKGLLPGGGAGVEMASALEEDEDEDEEYEGETDDEEEDDDEELPERAALEGGAPFRASV